MGMSILFVVAAVVVFLLIQRLKNPHVLARMGMLSKLTALLNQKPELVNARSRDGETPLIFAAASGRLSVVTMLLQKGADDCHGYTAREGAILRGYKDVAEIIPEK